MPTTLREGEPAPDITAETGKDETVRLRDPSGRDEAVLAWLRERTS